MNMSKKELLAVTGGGINLGVLAGIGAVITFFIGVIDGYLRPVKCES